MNVESLIASLVGTLAWPTVIIFALTKFRPQIAKFLEHLKSAKIGSWLELSASEDLRNTAEKSGKQTLAAKVEMTGKAEKDKLGAGATVPYMAVMPLAPILNVWSDIERQLHDKKYRAAVLQADSEVLHALLSTQVSGSDRISRKQALTELRARTWIPEVFIESVEEILNLGDEAIERPDLEITQAEAANYVSAAKSVWETLTKVA